MAVRNFWLEANIDGRDSTLAGGPRNKDGGMYVNIYQRQNGGGKSKPVIQIRCYVGMDGKLYTKIYDADDELISETKTER